MDAKQEPVHRLRCGDTIRQTLESRRSDRSRHNSGIEVWKLLRELGDVIKSLNTATGATQLDSINSREICGSTQKINESWQVKRSQTDQGAVRNFTSVVAIIRSQTQNGEETTTESWWLDLLDTGYLKLRSRC